jgi:hypothetical protein
VTTSASGVPGWDAAEFRIVAAPILTLTVLKSGPELRQVM